MEKLRFIDLFAGIGGTRLAFENLGCECVFSSEIDKQAIKTYMANFDGDPTHDITTTESSEIPEFDILVGGFPCQAFSIAGKRRGFEDTRGTLFFEVARILRDKRPKAFLLENVKGLKNHNKGNTLRTILSVLRDDLGYFVPEPEILNSKDFGVPQHRERIIIVGFENEEHAKRFKRPKSKGCDKTVSDILEPDVDRKYYISQKYLDCLERHRSRHAAKGNGFGYEVLDPDGISNAVVCGGMGRERNLVKGKPIELLPPDDDKGKKKKESPRNQQMIRKLTPRECANLQGFPPKFKIEVADTYAYKQFGNTVTVPLIEAVAAQILAVLKGKVYGSQQG
jgi:DNA (cytosine-5)-methyltransferase 1